MDFTKTIIVLTGLLVSSGCQPPSSAESAGDLNILILDVGAGLSVIIDFPGDGAMVYDAGRWTGNAVTEGMEKILESDEPIRLLALSHSDADHIGQVVDILGAYHVDTVLRTGYERDTATWKTMNNAVNVAESSGELADLVLSETSIETGHEWVFGQTTVTFIQGFSQPLPEWTALSEAEKRNAISLVLKVSYAGKEVLLTGDMVGRHAGAPQDASPIASEAFALSSSAVMLGADVLIAPHHGADNASSSDFIEAISPEWVVFSAGHDHEHPRHSTALRYLAAGLDAAHLLRTDLGDDESEYQEPDKEWIYGRIDGSSDSTGDDNVLITISASGEITVAYEIVPNP
jgi:beta-lactamase superfamily II metal-dependent hydrolase